MHPAHCHWPLLTLTYFSHLAEECLVCAFLEPHQQSRHSHSVNFLFFSLLDQMLSDKGIIRRFYTKTSFRYSMGLRPALVAHLDALSDWRPGGRGFNPRRGRQHFFMEIDHEIFSTVILSLPLIQEGQLSVSGERMCTILVNRLED